MARPHAFKVTTRGTYLGLKINSTSQMFARLIKEASYDSRDAFMADVMPIMEERFKELVPKYREQLAKGTTALGQDPLVNVQGGAKAKGLGEYESTFHHSGKNRHRPHNDIPDPLTRLVSEKGMSVKIKKTRDTFTMESTFKNTRSASLNFHLNMPKVPKASTLARRLDQTCLPFIRNGWFAELTNIYAANAAYSMSVTLAKYLENRDSVKK